MKVLVTGGAGFIGKYLVRSLLENGDSVTIFDNFSNSTKDSVSSLVDIGAKIIEGDIVKPLDILNAVKDQDTVIHLAAKISVSESIRNPSETFHVNVDGTRNVLVACEKNHVKKLVVSSSAAVYGEGLPDVRITEETKTNPISPYGESKVKMEQEIREFASKHDIDCIILRFFNIYGIGQTKEYAGVISKFAECIKNDSSITIYGKGDQTRDFISIDDVIKSILQSISNIDNEKYEIINMGTGISTSINELAKIMLKISGKKNEINHVGSKTGDIRFSKTSVAKAQKYFNFNSKISLEEGIKKCWDDF